MNIDAWTDELPTLAAIFLIIVAFAAVLIALGRARGLVVRRRPQSAWELGLLFSIARWALIVIGFLSLLQALNVPIGNLWAAISAVAALVAIGFVAVWSILSHVTAWLILLFQRPFRPGETVQFGDEEYAAKVVRYGTFFTTVEDADGGFSRIPNNLFFQKRFRVTGTPAPGEEREDQEPASGTGTPAG